ncbi:hypothetical protein VNO78_33530 [Psophocarpus tetragonolobus]|uniref:Uncharacterized protein n=1 Tax=Psophocarpus tetragonolobus TaxID=3891 RepID=A0AAN9P1A9_PSOTE
MMNELEELNKKALWALLLRILEQKLVEFKVGLDVLLKLLAEVDHVLLKLGANFKVGLGVLEQILYH